MRFTFVALAVVTGTTPLAAQQRAIADTDIYAFRWIAQPQISPDGRQVAFLRVTVNAKHDCGIQDDERKDTLLDCVLHQGRFGHDNRPGQPPGAQKSQQHPQELPSLRRCTS